MEYKKCEKCGGIIPTVEGEKKEECLYCGSEEGLTRASEKEWREYYTGIVMQPFEYRTLKPSTQVNLPLTC